MLLHTPSFHEPPLRQCRSSHFLESEVCAAIEAIACEARSQYRGAPLKGLLAVNVALHWPDRRISDVDKHQLLLDADTGVLWVDDAQILVLHTTKAYDRLA